MNVASQRVRDLPPYLFAEIDRLKRQVLAEGRPLFDFGVGDPDLPTPPFIVEELRRAVGESRHHRYPSYVGRREFRAACAEWCTRRHGFRMDPDTEFLTLIGSKEGIGHFPLAALNPGELALVTDPGYPVYVNAVHFAGGQVARVPLREELGWRPDLAAIDPALARRAKLFFLNYPNNPIGATADVAFYEQVVAFARQHDLFIVHDAAYAELGFEGYRPPSLMAVPGGSEVGIEFHSFSKTFNMTGWRVGFAVGRKDAIFALGQIKTNLDSGVFEPIQIAAEKGYAEGEAALAEIIAIYQRRRDLLVDGLEALGLKALRPKAAFYVWTRVPAGESAAGFAARLLAEAGVVCSPGTGFGPGGEGFVRFSLTAPEETLRGGLAAMARVVEGGRR